MRNIPRKLFYLLYALVLWIVLIETSARVRTPIGTGLLFAIALALLWPFR